MVFFTVLLAVGAIAAIAGTVTLTMTDGYGRVPDRTFARTI